MPLFGERRACAHCGQKVKKPKTPEIFQCPKCGEPGPWASGDQVKKWESWQEARGDYDHVLTGVIEGSGEATQELAQLAPLTGMSEEELFNWRVRAFVEAANRAIGDQILTPEEDSYLERLMQTLGVSWDATRAVDPMLPTRAFVSAINGGTLPEVAQPNLLPKKGEIVHFEVNASLMKEVAIKEYRGGSSGFSVPIGKGFRYRVGNVRGRMVQVGTRLEVADSGLLAVTNKRAVYIGSRKTIDMPLAKLVNLNVFSDGVQFHMSNRVNPPLFQINVGSEVVAAIVNAAAQRLE